MSGERVMMKSKIPVKAKSCIPVRTDVNKKSSTALPKTTADRNKPVSTVQGVPSKERLKSGCQGRQPTISTNKTLKTKQSNQVKKETCSKPSFKETNRARLKVDNPPKTLGKPVKASTSVPSVKTKMKVQPTKSNVESHPSQPDIEFVPDEISRKRILGCIELPSAPNAMSRGQTSMYNRPSLYQLNPINRPSDPCKALLKTLQSLKMRDRESVQAPNWRESVQAPNWRESVQAPNWRESVQAPNWRESVQAPNRRESCSLNRPSVNKIGLKPPDFAPLKTLENINGGDWSLKPSGMQGMFVNKCFPLARKTPKMVLEEAKKRFQEQKLKEENKSVKKVTFQGLNSALGKENKCLIESKPVDKQEKTIKSNQDKIISESLTPDLSLKKTLWKKDKTPTSPPAVLIPSKEGQGAGSNFPKKPVSILKNKIFPELDARRGSLFCSKPFGTGFGKLRRSISFSAFPPPSPTPAVRGNPSVQVQSFEPVGNLGQQSSPAFLRRSISSPEFAALCSSIAAPLPSRLACDADALSPASKTILKLQSIQKSNHADGLRSSVSASGLRGSLFLTNNRREVRRRSISSPDIAALRASIAAPLPPSTPMSQACNSDALSPASRTILKLQSIQKHNLADKLRSSISASGLRGSLFLTNKHREVPQSKNPKLCTPVPVSLYPRSQAADSFSPEFLCPRTSNFIADAPIKTPLVLKNLAAREENDDLNQVRQKLIFMPPAEEKPKQKILTHVHKQNKQDYSADQECSIILCRAIFPYICSQNVLNPIAKTLESGDEMHFVPVSPGL